MAIRMKGGYFDRAYDDPTELINDARRALESVNYDTMVGTGLSGALVIPTLAKALGKTFLIIRKDSENNHSGLQAEGELGDRWIFVDDFISSGATKRRVMDVVEQIVENHSYRNYNFTTNKYERSDVTFVGSYMYTRARGFTPNSELDEDDIYHVSRQISLF